jgi:hypothetical protein
MGRAFCFAGLGLSVKTWSREGGRRGLAALTLFRPSDKIRRLPNRLRPRPRGPSRRLRMSYKPISIYRVISMNRLEVGKLDTQVPCAVGLL